MSNITKVFIIQSLKTTDTCKSGEELDKKLKGYIQTDFKNVETDNEFFAQLDKIKTEITATHGRYVIHFDCHGNKGGIGVFDKTDNLSFLSWEDLRDKLREIFLASEQKPIVSFSSCEGFNVIKLVAHFKPCPYDLITGSFRKIAFQDSVDGYFMFYTNLDKGIDIATSIKQTRDNFPTLDFAAFTAKQLFHIGWAAYLNTQLSPERIRERKESIIAEIISMTGTITPEQEKFLDNCFTNQASDEHFESYKNAFFS